jgi:hypothetical protein
MNNDIPLRGLQVNGQPFFARWRQLTLSATGCPRVLKLSWLVDHELADNHFLWLLSRLERCATIDPPWQWSSHHPDDSLVSFWAWLVSPVGYGGDARGSLHTTFQVHVSLALDNPAQDTPPVFCPSGCDHDAPRATRETHQTPLSVQAMLCLARRQPWTFDEMK